MDGTIIPYAYSFETYPELRNGVREFIDKNRPDVEIVKVEDQGLVEIYFKNGDMHALMTQSRFEQWCMGRAYHPGNNKAEVYRSGSHMIIDKTHSEEFHVPPEARDHILDL